MRNIDVIRATSLFEGVGEKALAFFDKNAIASSYSAKSVIAAEGSLGDCLFIIKSGSVDVVLSRETKDLVKMAELTAGDFAGEMSLIDSQPRSASLIAREDTEVLIITRATLLDLHSKDFDAFMKIIVNITRRIGNRLRQTDKVLANIGR